jgi:hypothetical protein
MTVTVQQIEDTIVSEHYFTAANGLWDKSDIPEPLHLLTFCVLVLKNGFTIVGSSACADPTKFDVEMGRKIARERAVQKMWSILGYELKSKLYNEAMAGSASRSEAKAEHGQTEAGHDLVGTGEAEANFARSLEQAELRRIAKIAHEANRAWCEFNGDFTQPTWEDAPEWQKSCAVLGVKFHLDNPDATDGAVHEKWMKERLAIGWKWGAEKDVEQMTHPCLMPFKDLPPGQQFKDKLFCSMVRAAK